MEVEYEKVYPVGLESYKEVMGRYMVDELIEKKVAEMEIKAAIADL